MTYSKEEALKILNFSDADELEEWLCELILYKKKFYQHANRMYGLTINNSDEESFLLSMKECSTLKFDKAYYVALILNIPVKFKVCNGPGDRFVRTTFEYEGYEFASITDL